jgi:hypothetical protein
VADCAARELYHSVTPTLGSNHTGDPVSYAPKRGLRVYVVERAKKGGREHWRRARREDVRGQDGEAQANTQKLIELQSKRLESAQAKMCEAIAANTMLRDVK